MADDQPFVELPGAERGPGRVSGRALLWAQVRPKRCSQWFLMSGVLACVLLNKALVLLSPLTWRFAVDALSGGGPEEVHAAACWILAYSALAVLADGLTQIRGALWGRLSNDITKQVSIQLFSHLHALSLRWHLNRKTGEVLRVIDIGVKAVTSIMSVIGFSMGPTILELVLVSGIFLRIGVPGVSLCVLASAVLYVAYTVLVTRRRTQHRRSANDASKAMQDKAVDSLLNFETVKLFAGERSEVEGYDAAASAYRSAQVRSQDSLSLLNWGQTVAMQLGLAGGLLLACRRAGDGEMTVGEFVMIQLYILQIFRPLISLGSNYNSMMQSLADLEKMTELLAIRPEVEERQGAGDLRDIMARIPREQRAVEFDDVTFFYQPGKPGGVKHLSFKISSGGSVALVGPSGSGKSTSTRLLCRLLEVTGGSVRVGEVDVRDVTQHSLRSCVSVVSQDTVLFNSTIRANLTYGKPDASEAEVEKAAGLAQVSGFLGRMEGGYDAKVGERGLRLSGGEKQRLGIARALLTDPSVLVLDEATSALDSSTEREVQEALGKAAEGRCTLMIAHRLSTVVDAGEILVLRAGEVVERGTHQALLEARGLFAEMWAAQASVAKGSSEQCRAAIEFACACRAGCCK